MSREHHCLLLVDELAEQSNWRLGWTIQDFRHRVVRPSIRVAAFAGEKAHGGMVGLVEEELEEMRGVGKMEIDVEVQVVVHGCPTRSTATAGGNTNAQGDCNILVQIHATKVHK